MKPSRLVKKLLAAAGVGARSELRVPQMKKRLIFAGSIVVAVLATASVILDVIAITLAEAMEETP
jgi:hypothetical protein